MQEEMSSCLWPSCQIFQFQSSYCVICNVFNAFVTWVQFMKFKYLALFTYHKIQGSKIVSHWFIIISWSKTSDSSILSVTCFVDEINSHFLIQSTEKLRDTVTCFSYIYKVTEWCKQRIAHKQSQSYINDYQCNKRHFTVQEYDYEIKLLR